MSILSELKKLTGKNNATVVSEALPDSMSGGGNGNILLHKTDVFPADIPDNVYDFATSINNGVRPNISSAFTISSNIEPRQLFEAIKTGAIPVLEIYAASFQSEIWAVSLNTYLEYDSSTNDPRLIIFVVNIAGDLKIFELYVINDELWSFYIEGR